MLVLNDFTFSCIWVTTVCLLLLDWQPIVVYKLISIAHSQKDL